MRFTCRQLLIVIAFIALTTAYVTQSVRYSTLLSKHQSLEARFARTRDLVEQVAHLSISDQETSDDTVTLHIPHGWSAMIRDEWADLPPEAIPEEMRSRLASQGAKIKSDQPAASATMAR